MRDNDVLEPHTFSLRRGRRIVTEGDDRSAEELIDKIESYYSPTSPESSGDFSRDADHL